MIRTNVYRSIAFLTVGAEQAREEFKRQLLLEVSQDHKGSTMPPLPPQGWSLLHPSGSRQLQLMRRVTYTDIRHRFCRSTVPGNILFGSKKGKSAKSRAEIDEVFFHMGKNHPGKAAVAESRNSEANELYATVEVRAAFINQDWSHWDPNIDLCEWVPFDCIVRRPHNCKALCIGFTNVNAQLRLRRIQLAHPDEFETLSPTQGEGNDGINDGGILTGNRSSYGGPNPLSLSKAMNDQILDYAYCLGLDNRLAEYVCQMLYYLEHQEYLTWLARVADFVAPKSLRQLQGSDSLRVQPTGSSENF